MIYCQTHSKRLADFHCPECEVGLCKDCVKTESVNYKTTLICPFCRKPVTSLAPYQPLPPIWTLLPEILVLPFRGNGKMIFLEWAIISMVFFLIIIPLGFSALLLALALSWVFYYGILISKKNGKSGSRKRPLMLILPDVAEYEGVGELLPPLFIFLSVALAGFWPTAVCLDFLEYVRLENGRPFFENLLSPFHLVPLILALGYGLTVTPMALLVMRFFGKIRLAWNPIFLLRQIGKIKREYSSFLAAFLCFLLILGLASWRLYLIFSGPGPWWVLTSSFLLFSIIQLYLLKVSGLLLGYLAAQTRLQLGWWPDAKKPPVFMVAGRPMSLVQEGAAVSAKMDQPGQSHAAAPAPEPEAPVSVARALHLLETGDVEPARSMLQTLIYVDSRDEFALRAMVQLAIKTGDRALTKKFGWRAGKELRATSQFDAMWEDHVAIERIYPEFTYLPEEQFALATWLVKQDLFLEAARAFRELGSQFPDDPLAAPALLECGELLRLRCGKPDTAKQVYEYLLQHYPDSPQTKPAERGLLELQPQAKKYVELPDEETPE